MVNGGFKCSLVEEALQRHLASDHGIMHKQGKTLRTDLAEVERVRRCAEASLPPMGSTGCGMADVEKITEVGRVRRCVSWRLSVTRSRSWESPHRDTDALLVLVEVIDRASSRRRR
jgi:hypothetical protein